MAHIVSSPCLFSPSISFTVFFFFPIHPSLILSFYLCSTIYIFFFLSLFYPPVPFSIFFLCNLFSFFVSSPCLFSPIISFISTPLLFFPSISVPLFISFSLSLFSIFLSLYLSFYLLYLSLFHISVPFLLLL